MNDYAGVIERANLVDLVQKAGGNLKRSGKEWRCACPLHSGHNPTGFSVYEEAGHSRWHCYTGDCNGGDALDFVQKWLGFTLEEAYQYLGGERKVDPAEMVKLTVERAERAERALQKTIEEAYKALEELRSAKKWLEYHEAVTHPGVGRNAWLSRGVPEVWQELWQLGYCTNFAYKSLDELCHSPSLSIPVFDGHSKDPVNIRHRILNPVDPNDKYRPDRPGLKAAPFMCDHDHLDLDNVLIVEGEIKSMVTYIHLDSPHWQVFGIPGKKSYRELCESLKGHKVWILFDPDALEQAQDAAGIIGGARIIDISMKVDDALNSGYLDTSKLRSLIKMAKRA
jgi:hypothetical protein